jgi:predicted Rossmann-fold nucleotide-binding protein
MTVAIVCGGRNYGRLPFNHSSDAAERARIGKQAFVLRETLDHLLRDRGIREIIVGGATGADNLAQRWATDKRIKCTVIKARWRTYGKAAGPIRNQEMLEQKPDFVVAFPGGDGTADMVRRARAAGVEVLDYGGAK